MAAPLGGPALLEHDDLVHLIQLVELVGDEQHRPAGGGRKQVGQQRLAGRGLQAGCRLVQDQHRRVSEQCAGQGNALPLAPGDGGAARACRSVESVRQRPDPGQQPGPRRRLDELVVGGVRPGQAQVGGDRAREDVRILRAAADDRAHVVCVVAGQVVAAQLGGAAGQVAEPQQHGGHCGLARPVRADEGDAPAGRQVEVKSVERERPVRLVPDAGAAQARR